MDADVPEELQVGHATEVGRSWSVSALMRRKRPSAIPESLDVRPCVLLPLSPRSDRHRQTAAPILEATEDTRSAVLPNHRELKGPLCIVKASSEGNQILQLCSWSKFQLHDDCYF